MAQGKVKAALPLLSSQSKGKVLNPDDIASGVESAEAQLKTVLDTEKKNTPKLVLFLGAQYLTLSLNTVILLVLKDSLVIPSAMQPCISREQLDLLG